MRRFARAISATRFSVDFTPIPAIQIPNQSLGSQFGNVLVKLWGKTIILRKILLNTGLIALCLICTENVYAQEPSASSGSDRGLEVELYASLRLHLSRATVDAAFDGGDRSYTGLTDAYSRVGAKAGFTLGNTKFSGKLELGLNSAELELGDPSFFDDQDLRIKSITASGDWGTLVVGKDWLPYYNNVGYPVDYFSTIYAGYTTYAFFRENQIAYTSPRYQGLRGEIARIERTSGGPSGWHYVANYQSGGLTLAIGQEDMDGSVGDTQGASASYTDGPWYLAAKYENSDTGNIYNGFVQYSRGKASYKFGLGLGDQFSGDTYHLGVDYQLSQSFKLFTEFYSEDRNYAILQDRAETSSDYFGAGGFGARQNGTVLAFGLRHDFSTPL